MLGWYHNGGYTSVRGKSYVEDVTFAYFNTKCNSKDVAIAPNKQNVDCYHPMTTQRITWYQTDYERRVYFNK